MKTAPQPSVSSPKEKIILGIDPGTNLLGYGLVRVTGKKVEMMAMGVIDMRKCADGYL
ncbi:MAG: crossover junction endodeoxyribonuclease RuvC, partial [Bacteroidaceae bacterium]|nr:crossover junction endodeoxyribonuclease RuvC [Bacteroidaceae bacterium]